MLLLALALATMPKLIGPPLQTDLTSLSSFVAETRPMDFRVRLFVDRTGMPASCEVEHPDSPRVARTVCDHLLSRTRFAPARDAAGVAMPAVVRVDLSLNHAATLRPPANVSPEPGRLDFAMQVARLPNGGSLAVADLVLTTGTDGRVKACDVARSTGSDALDRLACRQMADTTFYPGVDRDKQPLVALRQVSVGFTADPVPQ